MLDGMKNCAASEFSGLPFAVPSEESKTPFLPICIRSLLPSWVYFCTIPDGALATHTFCLVEMTAVQARIRKLGIAPRMDHIAVGIELDHRRSQASGIELAIEHVLPVEVQHVVLGIDTVPAQASEHPAVRQMLGPIPTTSK